MQALVVHVLVGLLVATVVLALGIVPRGAPNRLLTNVASRLGLSAVPAWLLGAALAVWAALFAVFLFGLFWVPVFLTRQDFGAADDAASDLRWTLFALAAMTAALSAVVALPFTLLRTRYTSRQTDAEEEGLLTDRINKAVEGLGAEKAVNRLGRTVTFTDDSGKRGEFQWKDDPDPVPEGATDRNDGAWQPFAETRPNLEVRIGAIYALERLAQRNIDAVHVQIMQILCAYIRENAPATDDPDEPQDWLKEGEDKGPLEADWRERKEQYDTDLAARLETVRPRADIRTALEVIGKRSREQRRAEARHGHDDPDATFVFDEAPDADTDDPDDAMQAHRKDLADWKRRAERYRGYRLDLSDTDLRRARLRGLNFAGAKLDRAWLQGAQLDKARLQGASLYMARLQGASLGRGRLQGASLTTARLQGASLTTARLQRAQLVGARLQGGSLRGARLQGASLGWARLQGASLYMARLQGASLGRGRLQGASLDEARLQGAWLDDIAIDAETGLSAVSNPASALRSTDYTICKVPPDFFVEAFGDASVKGLPEGCVAGDGPLAHWSDEVLDDEEFVHRCHAWQVEIGYRAEDDA